ncbi:HlyD family efflux transporter periplasmic adaptor subunit [Vibrio alginolyticus]|uniref:HlyD family secretion protein n=1 Tax=Vibrio alginolyticus TaxID=663 RepID=UPI001A2DDC72|nr:HlyD family efflux transporter periplasmic adaptor subunit [Vibrio alginolyticus]EGQ7843182.1 HlyD family efflux transporter periplasmic adaptor subunit [Vibrio alginolyticus]EGQ7845517.1 HlyD family efflux transporter periplasmic adaptor subunit [Vibrio alginolyticus]MCS0187519.1 HlyD family efflux transporter periplasmic adaptor subunit [Vibrio alginolyticus]
MKRIILGTLALTLLTACSKDDGQQALGTLERDRVTFTATSSEIIRALPIKEGSQVTEGEVLVQLDTKNQEAVLAHAVAEQAKADAYLLKLTNGERPEDIAAAQARVARAEAQLVEAQKNYQRKAELVRKKLISQSEKDSALALQEQKLAELTITATRDGLLDNLPFNLGERVPVNGIVAVIQASRVPYARVYVPANYRVDFVPGKTVNVHVDGVEQPYSGTVRWVATEPSFTPYFALTEEERSRLMYLAEVDLQDSAQSLPSGIPAQVDLVE